MDLQKTLRDLHPEHAYFIGIDSDGCVFDTMEVKQKRFFIPNAINIFNLSLISERVKRTWEFVNLYSVHRGGNRFLSLIKVIDLLGSDPEVVRSGVHLPDVKALKAWTESENKLGNDSLGKFVKTNPGSGLEKILLWSETVNRDIEKEMGNIPPFPMAAKAIKHISHKADIVVVSQTPYEAVEREWNNSDLKKFIRLIAAQEHGTKSEQLAYAAKGKYDHHNILMIGDAMGDLEAARNNNALFYPVISGHEDESWQKFISEGFTFFLNNTFKGPYQDKLIKEFLDFLPDRFINKD